MVTAPAKAAEPFVVKDIRVEGLQRVEPGTIFGYLPVKVGDRFDDEKASESVRALFNTGFFKDVKLTQDQGGVLVLQIEELPSIAQLDFSGLKEFDKDAIRRSLRSVGVAEARFFNRSVIERTEQELKRQYVSRGYYAAEVQTTVTPQERNRVAVTFTVDEGPVAKIRQINIVGNKTFKEGDLLDEMQLSTPNWLSWYTRSDQYSKQKLTADLEALRSYYLDRGFLEFEIESTQVSITPDRQDIYLTINVKEGERFTVSEIRLAGELLNKKEELEGKLTLKKGDTFSASKLSASTKAITDLLGVYGYAFAAVNPQPVTNREKHEVMLNLVVDPGKRVYVRRINVVGNQKTRDEVVRREMRQMESSWFDGDRLKLSKERVNRTGYFTGVDITTDDVAGTADQVDVNVNVTEKPTGSITLGAGYSSTDKIVLSAGIHQENVFGSGTSLGLDVNTSHVNRTIALSQYDPYFTIDGVSRVTDVYYRTSQPLYYLGDSDYKVVTAGGSFKLGVPFTEIDRVFFGLGAESTNITLSVNSPPAYQTYVSKFGTQTTNIPFTVGWSRDGRDSTLVPTKGRYQQANAEIGTPIGDLTYYRLLYQNQYYVPLNKGYVLAFNTEAGWGHGYGGKSFPITKNYFAGGIGSVRGYETSTLGPSQTDALGNTIPTGGSSKLVGSVEFTFPIPGSGVDRTLRLFTFMDAGNVFREGQMYNISELRYSYGLGLSWISPLGPLKFSFGFPFRKKAGDRTQRLQFQIGTAF